MALTPAEWLPILAKRLDDRQPRVSLLRSYTDGTSPVPEMSANTREAWIKFQRMACTLLGKLIADAVAERMSPNGYMIGDRSPAGESTAAETAARRIWRDNRMDVVVADTLMDMLTCSVGYLMIAQEDGKAIITSEKPELMYAATDPLRPWISRAGIKVYRDEDAGQDYAYVWTPGWRQKFSRPSKAANGRVAVKATGGWTPMGEAEPAPARIPIFILENKDGRGEFESYLHILNRINYGVLQRLVITAYQAFKQRAIKGELAEEDEDGNPNDWAQLLTAAPGAMWKLPKDVDVWESDSTDIRPILEASKEDIRSLAAESRTPVPALLPDGSNQSAEGAVAAREGLIFKTKDRIARVSPGLAAALACAIQSELPDFDDTVEITWAPPQLASLTERYAAAAQAKAADVPWRTRMIDILGFSADKVDQMELDLASEQLQLGALLAEAEAGNGRAA